MTEWKEYMPAFGGEPPADWQKGMEVQRWDGARWYDVIPNWVAGSLYRYRPAQPDWQEQAIAAGWTPPPEPVDPLQEIATVIRDYLSPLGDEQDVQWVIASMRKAGVIHKSEVEGDE